MGFVEAVGVIVAGIAVLGLGGAVAYWLLGIVANGTARICTSRHFVASQVNQSDFGLMHTDAVASFDALQAEFENWADGIGLSQEER